MCERNGIHLHTPLELGFQRKKNIVLSCTAECCDYFVQSRRERNKTDGIAYLSATIMTIPPLLNLAFGNADDSFVGTGRDNAMHNLLGYFSRVLCLCIR